MIKFRAWDKENEIYLYNVQDAYDTLSGFVKYDDGEYAGYDEDCFGDFLDNERYVVEQFTGLTDVNGKEIYVGDVVESDSGRLFAVCFGEQNHEENYGDIFKFQGFNLCTGLGYPDAVDITYEIIGNVHENPELLEVRK